MTRRAVLALLCAAALASTAGGAVRQDPGPPLPAGAFRAVLSYPGGSELLLWQAPERFSSRLLSGTPLLGRQVESGGTTFYRYSPTSPPSLFTRTLPARPDSVDALEQLRGPSDFVLAEARRGALRLEPRRLAGEQAWYARLFAPANKCAGLPSGRIELWLRRADLLPLRLVERHGTVGVRNLTLAYRSVNARPAAGSFAIPRPTVRPYRADQGFVRAGPAAAAAHLPYRPLVPRTLPPGFRPAVSGWARRSGTTGAEGSIPPRPAYFAAVYRRGVEHLDLTERLAPARGGWSGDPFGAECVRQLGGPVQIGRYGGVYGAGPQTTPHLYWRQGRLLVTLSGPFPRRDLVAVARSLAPVE